LKYSWIEGNRSFYLWDAGLWAACKESRHVIMEHFGVPRCEARRRKLVRGTEGSGHPIPPVCPME
jgi:hypothetical protein